jgi:hypothetical protein
MNINNSTPVLPNFIRGLCLVFISALSLTAYANHHEENKTDAVEETVANTDVMHPTTDKDAYTTEASEKIKAAEKAEMTDEEIKEMLKEEKRKSEMKHMMDDGEAELGEKVEPE